MTLVIDERLMKKKKRRNKIYFTKYFMLFFIEPCTRTDINHIIF